MFGFSIGEILLLAVIALIVVGPKQLPDFARQIGRLLNDIKRSTSDFAEEMKNQARIDFDVKEVPKPPKPETEKKDDSV
jgi:sec-independent protein translocase protein TatB